MSRHRVPMLTASLHRYPDPARSPDPAVRALVSRLAGLDLAPDPAPEFKAELRSRLVAAASRAPASPGGGVVAGADGGILGDGADDAVAAPVPAVGRAAHARVRWRRPVAVGVSSLAVTLLVLGVLVWLSGSALPGGPLYQLKRTAESVQLALTSGSDAKARLELQFATVRSDEVTQLISRPSALGAGLAADASISPVTASLIRTTLTSANGDVLAATQLLTQAALRAHSTAPLKILAEWAPGQRERLGEIADRLPAGALRQLALQSARMVEKAKQRVVQLTQVVRCDCGTTKGSDRYGPVPCKTCGTAGSASRSSTNPAVTAVPVPASTPGSVPAPAGSTAPAPYQPDPPAPVEGSTPSGGVSPGPGSTDSPTQVPPTSSAPAVPSDSSDSSLPSLTPSPSSPTLPDAGSTSTDAPPDPSSAPPPSEPSLSDPSSSVPADPPASDLPPTCVPTAASGLDGC